MPRSGRSGSGPAPMGWRMLPPVRWPRRCKHESMHSWGYVDPLHGIAGRRFSCRPEALVCRVRRGRVVLDTKTVGARRHAAGSVAKRQSFALRPADPPAARWAKRQARRSGPARLDRRIELVGRRFWAHHAPSLETREVGDGVAGFVRLDERIEGENPGHAASDPLLVVANVAFGLLHSLDRNAFRALEALGAVVHGGELGVGGRL